MPEAGVPSRYEVKNQEILLYKGDTVTLTFRIKDARGGAYSFTGKTVKLAAKTNIRHTTTLWDKTATSTNTQGVAKFAITAADLATARDYLVLELYIVTVADSTKLTLRQFEASIADTVKA